MKRRLLLLTSVVIAGTIVFLWWRERWLEDSQDIPIRAASARYGVDPALVKAVVWRESRFHPRVRGRAGEIGLMQLREDAAREWADAEGVSGFAHEHCLDPVTNTMAGTFYLKKMLSRFTETNDPRPYALAAYNAGRANALKWAVGEASSNSAVFVQQIGFPRTRIYVKEILARSARYAPIFGAERPPAASR